MKIKANRATFMKFKDRDPSNLHFETLVAVLRYLIKNYDPIPSQYFVSYAKFLDEFNKREKPPKPMKRSEIESHIAEVNDWYAETFERRGS